MTAFAELFNSEIESSFPTEILVALATVIDVEAAESPPVMAVSFAVEGAEFRFVPRTITPLPEVTAELITVELGADDPDPLSSQLLGTAIVVVPRLLYVPAASRTYSFPALEHAVSAELICAAVAEVPAEFAVAQAPEVHCVQEAEGIPPGMPAFAQTIPQAVGVVPEHGELPGAFRMPDHSCAFAGLEQANASKAMISPI